MHGLWFHFLLPEWVVHGPLALPINVLEFVNFPFTVLTFWSRAEEVPAALLSDSLASYFSVVNESARAPLMRLVLERLLDCPEFNYWSSVGFWLGHTFGAGNPGADLASRGYFDQLDSLCEQLAVPSVRLPPPPAALLLWDALLAAHVSNHAAATARHRDAVS